MSKPSTVSPQNSNAPTKPPAPMNRPSTLPGAAEASGPPKRDRR